MNFFNKIEVVADTTYYQKIVGIAIGGHWDADAINYFQDGLQSRTKKNVGLIASILAKLNDKQIKSFWYFYFDEPHPKVNVDPQLMTIKNLNKKVFNYMMKAHKFSLKEAETSH